MKLWDVADARLLVTLWSGNDDNWLSLAPEGFIAALGDDAREGRVEGRRQAGDGREVARAAPGRRTTRQGRAGTEDRGTGVEVRWGRPCNVELASARTRLISPGAASGNGLLLMLPAVGFKLLGIACCLYSHDVFPSLDAYQRRIVCIPTGPGEWQKSGVACFLLKRGTRGCSGSADVGSHCQSGGNGEARW